MSKKKIQCEFNLFYKILSEFFRIDIVDKPG